MNVTPHCVVLLPLVALAVVLAASPVTSQFAPAVSHASTGPSDIAAGDLDGDGDPDLITANADGSCWSYINTGGGFAAGPLLPQPAVPADVKVADLDGTGDLDYVTALPPAQIGVHRSAGSWPGFLPVATYPAAGTVIEVEIADFDFDGDRDIAVLSQGVTSGTIAILANDGAGGFLPAWSTTTSMVPTGFTAGNLTSRGSVDLVYCGGTHRVGTLIAQTLSPLTFGPETTYPVDLRPSAVTTGDFNGDGHQDIACTSGSPLGVAASVLLNVGFGASGWPLAADFAPYVPYSIPGTSVYFGITDEDFDCDGDLDLALASANSGLVGVLFNDGAGAFGTPTTHPTATLCTDVVAADFDGQLPDAASANSGDMAVLLNTLPYGECEHVFIGGIRDAFVNPLPNTVEDACPGVELDTFLGAIPRSNFDDNSLNEHLAHTFVNLPDHVLEATLTVRMRPNGSASNDSIAIGFDVPGANFSWGRFIQTQVGFPWMPPASATVTFDLADLPGSVDVMRKLQADGRLDFRVQDDTAIDHLELRLITCSDGGNMAMEQHDHTPMVAFTPITFSATAGPGDVALFYLDLVVGHGPAVPPYGAFCLPAPAYFGFALEAGGSADLTFTWPPLPPCLTIATQALVITPTPLDARFTNTMTQQTFF
jgi:hypothetical protein